MFLCNVNTLIFLHTALKMFFFTEIYDIVAPELFSNCLCVKQQEITQHCCKKQL